MLTDFFGSVRTIELLNQTSTESASEVKAGEDAAVTMATSEDALLHGYYLSPQDALVNSFK